MIVNIATDKPWSQYFCCMLAGSPEYVAALEIEERIAKHVWRLATELHPSSPRAARRDPDPET